MTRGKIWSWIIFAVGALYFFLPLVATFEFSLRARRGVYSFDAYQTVLADPEFRATFAYSVVMAIHTLWLAARAICVGMGWVSIVDPAAANALLDVPEDWHFVALLCLGYPAHESETPELVRRHWQARLPADQTRFIR